MVKQLQGRYLAEGRGERGVEVWAVVAEWEIPDQNLLRITYWCGNSAELKEQMYELGYRTSGVCWPVW
jgi:hypothetical protein